MGNDARKKTFNQVSWTHQRCCNAVLDGGRKEVSEDVSRSYIEVHLRPHIFRVIELACTGFRLIGED